MGWLKNFFSSSVGKKQIMGLSGLMLCGFLVVHLIGNFTMLVSSELFNTYSHKLITNPIILVAEVVLLLIFLVHIGMAIRLTIENNAARPEKYYMKATTGRGATFASSTMPYTGALILIFGIIHLLNFKYGAVYEASYNSTEMRDLYRLVIEYFTSPFHVLFYVVLMVLLGIHVSHGFWSAFQSFGVNHPKYNGIIKVGAKLVAILFALGFSLFPIWAYFQGGRY